MALDRETVARILRTARENRGLSQQAVAKKLRVSRTLIAQIELGNRPVTDDELLQFANLYGRTLVEFKGTQVSEGDDPVTAALLKLAPELATDDMQTRIHAVLGPLLQASRLEGLLERPAEIRPPVYSLPAPRTASDAIAQGEQIADQERQRLGIRHAPITDLPRLIADQSVRVFAFELPEHVSGLFVKHASVGAAIVVNTAHTAVRRRFFMAHGYAHALFAGVFKVCKDTNSKELIEQRAHAFAAAFLLPSSGVEETVRRFGKGGGSRNVQWVFDGATDRAVRAEQRSAPGSQAITYVDAVSIAQRFGAAYNLTVSRLLGLGLISEADNERLLKRRTVELANLWLAIFGPDAGDVQPSNLAGGVAQLSNRVTELSGLDAERLHLFIEAYRRGLADKSDLPVELSVLVPGLSQETLLQFVEAAR